MFIMYYRNNKLRKLRTAQSYVKCWITDGRPELVQQSVEKL